MQTDGSQWRREVEKEDYIPCPFPKELMEPINLMHCLITLDTTILRPGPKFCDEDRYDIHPLNMVSIVDSMEKKTSISNLLVDEVSIEDVPIGQFNPNEGKSKLTYEFSNEDDWEALEEELDQVRLLLKHQEAVNISITP